MRGLFRRKGRHRRPVTSHRARTPRPLLGYVVFLANVTAVALLVWLYLI